MKINFIEADQLLLNGEKQPIDKYSDLQMKEFTLESKQGSFDLTLVGSKAPVVVKFAKKKMQAEYFSQK